MVENNDISVKRSALEEWLKTLEDEGIYSYYAEVYNEREGIEGFQVFVPREDIDVIESNYEGKLKELKVFLSSAVEGKILKILLKKLAPKFSVKVGRDIEGLTGNGFAVYLNWTNKAFMVHKYENGNFKSKNCKKNLFWETDNGTWIVGFKNCNEVQNFIEEVKEFLEIHFGVNYSVNYHRSCGAYEECKKEA